MHAFALDFGVIWLWEVSAWLPQRASQIAITSQ
jgi:hypothetical protein